MKHNLWTALALSASCVMLAGCATRINAQTEQACDIVYVDVIQDSTETLRQNLQNNKALEKTDNITE